MKESEERSSNIDEQKARIRQRYKGIDPEELEVIPALPPEDIFKTEKKLRVILKLVMIENLLFVTLLNHMISLLLLPLAPEVYVLYPL